MTERHRLAGAPHHLIAVVIRLALLLSFRFHCSFGLRSSPASWPSSITHVLEHLSSPPLRITPLEELTNTRIPAGPGVEILAYTATPPRNGPAVRNDDEKSLPVIILIHEFFGLNPSIVGKADGLAQDLGCAVICPDTYRGTVTDFIPRAIWLALTTPQGRVNDDLDAVLSYLESDDKVQLFDTGRLAVMGFCYGGGKAIRYTTQRRPDAATVVFYGSPVLDPNELGRLRAPVCGVFGGNDAQFPPRVLGAFREALDDAEVENDVRVYDGVGHAFWTDMEQVRRGQQPQAKAYGQCIDFLRSFFFGDERQQ